MDTLRVAGMLSEQGAQALETDLPGGPNAEAFLSLASLTSIKPKRALVLNMLELADRVSALLEERVSPSCVQSSSRMFMKAISCFTAGKTFSRARAQI